MGRQQESGHPNHGHLPMPGLILLLCLVFLLSGCGGSGSETKAEPAEAESVIPLEQPVLPEHTGLRIAVASDLHLDPDNTDRSSTASEAAYSPELVDALLWDARRRGSDLLLLTGDLVNGGKNHRHEALTAKLRQAEAEGLSVYVLPGNHDLAPVSQTEFAGLYAEFGYDEAASRDSASLSYSVLRDDLMLLMMDTGGYRPAAIDMPGAAVRTDSEAFLSPATLRWAETQLKEAQERGLTVLCAGHYNLLTELSREPGSGFYLENGDRFAALLRRYGVPLYLSGHMHIQTVLQDDGLTELMTEYLLSYPTGYSILDLSGRTLQFTPVRINVNGWAAETGQFDPVLRSFSSWQLDVLHRSCETTVAVMAERNALRKDEEKDAVEFFYAVMLAYWDGTLPERRDVLQTMPGCQPFFRCAEGYSYSWWLRDVMQSASPLLRGFVLYR